MRAGGLVIGFIHQPWRLAPESRCRQLARRRDLQQDLRGQLRDQRPRQGPSLCLSPWARTRVLYKSHTVSFKLKAGEIIHAPAAAGSAGAGVASELEVSSAAGEAAAAGSLSAAGAASALLVSAAAAGAASVASSLDPFVSRAVILDCSEDWLASNSAN